MQLLRFFVAQQITESPSMCSGTSSQSCLPALSSESSEPVLLLTASERSPSSSHFAILIRPLAILDVSAHIRKTALPPIDRVRRKRQRLPSSPLIENVAAPFISLRLRISPPRHFRSRLATNRQSDYFRLATNRKEISRAEHPRLGPLRVKVTGDSTPTAPGQPVSASAASLSATGRRSGGGARESQVEAQRDFEKRPILTR